MASTNKTGLGLNQWIGADIPQREDFNNDNLIINDELSKKSEIITEYGTWTPRLEGFITPGNNTYSAQIGEYYRIANHVWLNFYVSLSSLDSSISGDDAIAIRGLPFDRSGNVDISTFPLPWVENVDISFGNIMANFPRASFFILRYVRNRDVSINLPFSALSNTSNFSATFDYTIN